ncbi:PTS-dependent dihydroxyacetone kinase, ADP-binding subunit DhaL [Microbacterium hydrocarbonoxydans]|uniref:PTS-dependent dihydroxyacetone kinase, ADP-binding subunit DhaL n=1 Tax=Microbacterium hydrocarbonoxydans TaxID=273678 RepID=A0A0M2HLX0_9MICO|nr:dihydroxyacetone kinase subunit DhaL [Microbacterium hydrocarbonoxydans]KJL47727.1 PTS-dependent dihydroxyacetone kinase, ADP-binding subunit DhaL [Microbacterium hydrocarbonoxydans]
MGAVGTAALQDWISRFSDAIAEKREWLTELDSAIGDADHGANMARGMGAVVEKLGTGAPANIDDLLKTVGMTLVSSVGGASGPLYGTFFLRMGMSAGAVTSLDGSALGAALRAGLDGIVARGKPEAGDKTMFDAMSPAVDAFDAALAAESSVADAARAASDAAAAGRDATLPLVARKGRASYLGERSAGHLDPGAASTAILFETLADTIAAAS